MDNYYDLGSYSRPITTDSLEAQLWFDRGLMWLYGYNFEEAVKCFRNAADADPTCVMAFWGIAYGVGCNYNKAWVYFPPPEVERVMREARAALAAGAPYVDQVTPVEAALFTAVEKRFQAEGAHEEDILCQWNDEFAVAMREVYRAFPDDWDVATIFVETMMNRTPWQLWDLAAEQPAEGADTLESIEVVERALAQVEAAGAEPHVGLLHLYVHLMEMSPHPEKALRAADTLRELIPDAGHIKHMPSHIDILCGHYYEAVVANNRAIEVDDKYAAREGDLNEYTFYRAHDIHFKLYGAMLLGQYKTSMEAVDQLLALAHHELIAYDKLPMAVVLEGFVSMKLHVLIRFGKWTEILEEPFPEDRELYCNTVAMLHYARAIAAATLGDHERAGAERVAFKAAQAVVDEAERYIFNNSCTDILQVAEAMMNGEVAYHRGDYEAAFEYLRQAVYLDDHLAYSEPWGWMMPTRHALGALLLEQGHAAEAMAVYRADLGLDKTIYRPMQHPENVWALRGLVDCLQALDHHQEAAEIQTRLDFALARADVEIGASCFCATKGGA